MPPSPDIPQKQKESKEPVGPIVGIVVIFILMILGGIYVWYARSTERPVPIPYIPGDTSTTTPAS